MDQFLGSRGGSLAPQRLPKWVKFQSKMCLKIEPNNDAKIKPKWSQNILKMKQNGAKIDQNLSRTEKHESVEFDYPFIVFGGF